jgi:hypothetical protein
MACRQVCTLLFNYVDKRIHDFFIEGSYPPPETVSNVYGCLLNTGQEIVRLSAKEISAQIGIRNEITINSALIILEKAGHIERVQGRDEEHWSGARMIDRVAGEGLARGLA